MKKISAMVMILAILLLVGCASLVEKKVVTSTPEQAASDAVAATTGNSVAVVVENSQFMPTDVVIKVGDAVEWNNKDTWKHTITFDDGSFDEALPSGGSVQRTFTKAGEYTYHCSLHPGMQGKVIVE